MFLREKRAPNSSLAVSSLCLELMLPPWVASCGDRTCVHSLLKMQLPGPVLVAVVVRVSGAAGHTHSVCQRSRRSKSSCSSSNGCSGFVPMRFLLCWCFSQFFIQKHQQTINTGEELQSRHKRHPQDSQKDGIRPFQDDMPESGAAPPEEGNSEGKGAKTGEINWTLISVIVVVLVIGSLKLLVFLVLVPLLLLLLICTCAYFVRIPREEASSSRTRFPRFAFTKSLEWAKEVDRLQQLEVYTAREGTSFSPGLDRIVDLVVRDFVSSWLKSISSSAAFTNELKCQLNDAFRILEDRISNIDPSKLIVIDIVPLLTKHFSDFVVAEATVIGENNLSSSLDLDLKISKEYDTISKTHKLVELKNVDLEPMAKNYSRDRVLKFIKYLLPKEELNSPVVATLARELLSNVVLFPVLRLLTDPDFWNQIIVKFASRVLKDRDQVRELRSYLDKQYENPDLQNKPPSSVSASTKVHVADKKITPQMKQPEFENYIKQIEKSKSLPTLKQLRYFTAVQISRTKKISSKSDKFFKYCKRLNLAKSSIDKRITQLSPSDAQGADSKRNSVILSNDDLEGFITTLSLSQILSNPAALSFFMEFMEQRSRIALLQFWLTVNGIKDPLEDPQNPDYEEELASSTDLSGADDIKQIFNGYFNNKLLRIRADVYDEVKEFATGEKRSIEVYLRVRKLILLLQLEVFRRMEDRDLSDFKNSDLFLKLLASETFEESLISQVDVLQDYRDNDESQDDDEEEAFSPDGSLSEIENQLSKILTEGEGFKIPSEKPSSDHLKSVSSTDQLKSEIFGNSEHAFLEEKPLFEDSDDEFGSEIVTEVDELKVDNDFFSVSHDAFNLKEEITKLDQDIEKLAKQSSILDPLILKAELTDNLSELRLLRKSKSSFQREIERNELLRQQLIVQDNENSLFGKTSISINSWVKGHSESKDFIVYVIEVTKSSTHEGKQATSWAVGRRFSQFYKLNEILKKDIPEVNGISFPKKKIVLKFQQKSLIDERRIQLEGFLSRLLEIPEVCQHKEFRKFLTVDDYKVSAAYKVQASSIPKFEIKDAAKSLYNGIYSGIDLLSYRSSSTDDLKTFSKEAQSQPDSENVEDMRKELENFDYQPTRGSDSKSFVKPVTELFMAVFPFSKSNSWLRGRAIIVVLQQLFGSTIEKYIKAQIGNLTTEDRVIELISNLEGMLWPEGRFMESSTPRTPKEKIKTKQESKILLEALLVDTCSKIVGKTSSKVASNRLHAMLQNQILNNSLMYDVLDVLLEAIFPELKGQL